MFGLSIVEPPQYHLVNLVDMTKHYYIINPYQSPPALTRYLWPMRGLTVNARALELGMDLPEHDNGRMHENLRERTDAPCRIDGVKLRTLLSHMTNMWP